MAMIDITAKEPIPRAAIAEGRIQLKPDTVEAIKNRETKKGDALETARIAALAAIKATSTTIPHCHQIPIEAADVGFAFGERSVTASVRVSTTAKTGVEMEALIGASVALLTLWDMVKYLEKDSSGQYPTTAIQSIRVIEKIKGSRAVPMDAPTTESETTRTHRGNARTDLKFGIVVVSSSRTAASDEGGRAIYNLVREAGFAAHEPIIVPDDTQQIAAEAKRVIDSDADVLIFTGGTGLGKSDLTVDALEPLFEKQIPAFQTLFTLFSLQEIGTAAVASRATAGVVHGKPVFVLPGSPAACRLATERLILPEAAHLAYHTGN